MLGPVFGEDGIAVLVVLQAEDGTVNVIAAADDSVVTDGVRDTVDEGIDYMLFVLNAKGVPSEGKFIELH